MASSKSAPRAGKRLVVACDGTWVSSDNGFTRDSWMPWNTNGRLSTPSNVTRICRALLPRSKDGKEAPQVVYYQGGLGSQDNWWSFFIGGYLGEGISENIREAYAFICNNYEPGDDIILIGFSRGAFTARSIGGLIASIGLLTKEGLKAFYPIFRDWENQHIKGYVPKYESSVWPLKGRPTFGEGNKAYVNALHKLGLTRPDIPIKAIAVWDTVGALGVPNLKLGWLSLYRAQQREYAFINTEVAPNVENAYQALALDEVRVPFTPTVWETPDPASGARLQELRQCWFPGVHTSVGGGYKDTSISDITLAWMITRLSPFLSFDPTYVAKLQQANVAFYESISPPVAPRPYATGLIKRSDLGLVSDLTGRAPRTPGAYTVNDPETGLAVPGGRRLDKTRETVHPSVRYRQRIGAPGLSKNESDFAGQGTYDPAGLHDWIYMGPTEAAGLKLRSGASVKTLGGSGVFWVTGKGDDQIVLPEEAIEPGSPEWVLLNAWGKEVEMAVLNTAL